MEENRPGTDHEASGVLAAAGEGCPAAATVGMAVVGAGGKG
jgi:hypothetical protein